MKIWMIRSPAMGSAQNATGSPAVVGANWYQFRGGQRITLPRVDAVSFVWVLQGSGEIRLSGAGFRMAPGLLLRVPWRSEIEYRADERAPFRIGTIHLVPWHAADTAVEARVAVEGDDLFDAEWRRGPGKPEPPALRPASSTAGQSVMLLATYCVERFLSSTVTDGVARALGELVRDADASWEADPNVGPAPLNRMIDHISRNLDRHLTIAEIASAGGGSTATAQRLFRRGAGQSLVARVRNKRMQEAARLLRTTGLRVAEVARAVGFDDPLYFSRIFTRSYGTAPSRFADGLYP